MNAVDEEKETYRSCAYLRTIKHLIVSFSSAWRFIVLSPFLERIVHHRGIDALIKLPPYTPDHIEKLSDINTLERGNCHQRCKGKNGEQESHPVLYRFYFIRYAGKEIHLVENDDDTLASSYYEVGNLLVLLRYTFVNIDHEKNNIGMEYYFWIEVSEEYLASEGAE